MKPIVDIIAETQSRWLQEGLEVPDFVVSRMDFFRLMYLMPELDPSSGARISAVLLLPEGPDEAVYGDWGSSSRWAPMNPHPYKVKTAYVSRQAVEFGVKYGGSTITLKEKDRAEILAPFRPQTGGCGVP